MGLHVHVVDEDLIDLAVLEHVLEHAVGLVGVNVDLEVREGAHDELAVAEGGQEGQGLVGVEGLGKIVVRAGVEARDAVTLLALGREHHDGRFHALLPQLFEHLNTVHLGHHHV